MKQAIFYLSICLLCLGCSISPVDSEHSKSLGSTLWIQNAAEYRALSFQAFNLAKLRLEEDLKSNKSKKTRAIVVDIDETMLDNSPYTAHLILNRAPFTRASFKEWIDLAEGRPLPGAVSFMKFADSKGVELFYISNRSVDFFDGTYRNLIKAGFPAEKDNILLRGKSSSKEERRGVVLKKHRIVLLIGDNLTDFAKDYEKKKSKQRNVLVDKRQEDFGKRFIVLPNPVYGDWEQSLFNYDYKISTEEKERIRREHLYPYK